MANHSTLRRSQQELEAAERAKARLGLAPAIDFYVQDEEPEETKRRADKDLYRTFNVLLNPEEGEESNSYEYKIKVFRNGTPEDWCRLRQEVDSLAVKLQFNDEDENANAAKF